MREFLNALRNIFFTDIIGDIDLYTIISSVVKFIFVFIVLYYIYIIVKLIVLDIRNIDFEKTKVYRYISFVDEYGDSKKYLLENYTTIGRNLSNDIVLNSDLVSSYHAEIKESDGGYFLIDQESLNGTYLNGEFLTNNLELFDQDRIEIGPYKLIFTEERVSSTVKEE